MISTRKFVEFFSGHYKGVTGVFVDYPLMFSVSYDCKLKIWNFVKKKCVLRKKLNFVPLKIYVEKHTNTTDINLSYENESNYGDSNANQIVVKRIDKRKEITENQKADLKRKKQMSVKKILLFEKLQAYINRWI